MESPEPAAAGEDEDDHEETTGATSPVTSRTTTALSLDIGYASPKSLELSSQRKLLAAIELHTLDTVWHQVIPCVHNLVCTSWICCKRKQLKKTTIDKFIRFIYHKCHLCALATCIVLYVVWVLSGAYELSAVGTSCVYWWFILEMTALLYTANVRIFKELLRDFTFWYKTCSITLGVLCRQLAIDGTNRFTTSPCHMVSGISFILSYFVASQVVAALKAFRWPYYLTLVFILLTTVLNVAQIWQIYSSDHEFVVQFLGHTFSLRSIAMSSLTNATLFYLQQLFKDTFHRDTMSQMVRMKWVVDQRSQEIFYSGLYNFEHTRSQYIIKSMFRSKRSKPNDT